MLSIKPNFHLTQRTRSTLCKALPDAFLWLNWGMQPTQKSRPTQQAQRTQLTKRATRKDW